MSAKKIWTDEKVQEGFGRFFDEFGRYPTAAEITSYNHLPAVRTLQRNDPNGLKSVRQRLGLPITDYTKGPERSEMAKLIGRRGKAYEAELEEFLMAHFGKYFVHSEKPYGKKRRRVDFHVYVEDYEFAIDIFYPRDYESFSKCLAIKMRALEPFDFDLYLVAANPAITQVDIDQYIAGRKTEMYPRIKIRTYDHMLAFCHSLRPLRIAQTDAGRR